MSEALLEVEDLTVQYQTEQGMLTAVSDASLSLGPGEFFGLVGESGCGKSTLVKTIIGGLDSNGVVKSGHIKYRGEKLVSADESQDGLPWSEIAWIPQSSMSSLDPIERIRKQAIQIGTAHTDLSKQEILDQLREMFAVVGLPEERIDDYPHQFSGGMKQRALIALALFLQPSIIIADEPTTALDVIMQDQVLKYLDKVKDELETSMMLITHDISVVFETCNRMAIMHSGQIAERGTVYEIYDEPRHPYSIALQNAFPDIQKLDQELETINGAPPTTIGDVNYCTFADRCPLATAECREITPMLESVNSTTDGDKHVAACHHKDQTKGLTRLEDAMLEETR